MRKIVLACAFLVLWTSSAFAIGADLGFAACPGNAGIYANAASIDCATGQFATLYVTFMPAESVPDLAGIDVIIDTQVSGELDTDATFWDFETVNPGGMSVNHVRPSTGCTGYTATWSPSGSGEGAIAFKTSGCMERIKALAYRPTPLPYTTNQKMFGMSVTIDATTSAEAGGGPGTGCGLPAGFILNQVSPRTVSGSPTQDLTGPSVYGQCVTFNNFSGSMCFVVPTHRQTWGQLKSLYR